MLLLLAAAIGVLVAQQPTPPPVFRTSTDLVEIDVVVRDKSGALVTDLTADDFTLTEDGRPQKIEIATLIRHAAAASSAAIEAEPHLSTGSASTRASSGGELVTGTRRFGRPRVFVVVFDDQHLSPAGFRRVRAAALTLFDREFADRADLGGVIAGGRLAHGRLTSSKAELIAAVRDATPGTGSDQIARESLDWPRVNDVEAFRIVAEDRAVIDAVAARACRDEPQQCSDPRTQDDARDDVRMKARRLAAELRATSARTLATVASMLTNLASVEGAKTVLLLSEGFAADQSWDEVRQAVGLAARANARIYALDARGLAASGGGVLDVAPEDSATRTLTALGGSDDSINSLAVDTGGFVVRNANDMTRAIASIAQEAGTYYAIGYRPDRALDGKLRKVTVTSRRSGLTVRSRRAYVATPALMAKLTPPESADAPARPAPVASDPLGTAVREYSDLVRRYGAGDEAAVGELAAWPGEQVRRVVSRATGAPKPPVEYLRAAVALHTAVASGAWRGSAPESIDAQVEIAAAFVPGLLLPADPDYVSLWCRIAATLLTSSDQQGLALRQLDRCLAWRPGDATLLLARGSAIESASMVMNSLPPKSTLRDWPADLRDRAVRDRKAIADYEAALQRDPELVEARIRLARLRAERGDRAAAERALENLPAGLPPVLDYWAALIGGAAAEAGDKVDEAAARYRRALAAFPRGQSAALALAHLKASRLGDPDGAAALLHEQLAASPDRTSSSDPWWLYPMGQAWRTPEWLDELAGRSRP